jgi:F-box-like
MTSNNGRLPYDILGLIFHQYSLIPPSSLITPSNSGIIKLETLLLVCRAWHFAALGHRTLWSRLDMRIYNIEDLLYWKIHVPLRLSRGSPTALLDVTLIIGYKLPSPNGIEMLRSIVLDLIGTEGCVAKRWRTLFLHSLPDPVLSLFCVPTPNLVDLKLQFLGLQHRRLPETPVLETFCTIHSKWPYPDMQNVTNLTIRGLWLEDAEAEAISKAQKLIKLMVMHDSEGCQLRGVFSALEYLHLEDVLYEDSLNEFSAPRLKILSLDHHYRPSYRDMLKCPGIRFHALEELILCLDSHSWGQGVESIHPEGVRLVLQAAVNINVLRVMNIESLATMLKILGDLSICQNHHFTLKYLGYSMALRQGEARRAGIATIRLEADL